MSDSFDKTKFNGRIRLAADRKRGVWAAESTRRNGKTLRTAAQAPTTASAHSLLVLGLTSILRTWPQSRPAGRIGDRFHLLVTTDDPTFSDAIKALIAKDREQIAVTPLRAGKNLQIPLAKQMARYRLTYETAKDHDEQFRALHAWARSHVGDPKELKLAAIYQPVVTEELVWF